MELTKKEQLEKVFRAIIIAFEQTNIDNEEIELDNCIKQLIKEVTIRTNLK